MSFATVTNIEAINMATERFPITMSQWTINKVWYCNKTNSIRARFKNESIGMVGGVVKPDFSLKTTMEWSEILEHVTLDRIVFTEGFATIAHHVLNTEIE